MDTVSSNDSGAAEDTTFPPLPPHELRTAEECEQFLGTLPGGPAALSEAAARADIFNNAVADGSKQAQDSAQELQGLVAELCSCLHAACPRLTEGEPHCVPRHS